MYRGRHARTANRLSEFEPRSRGCCRHPRRVGKRRWRRADLCTVYRWASVDGDGPVCTPFTGGQRLCGNVSDNPSPLELFNCFFDDVIWDVIDESMINLFKGRLSFRQYLPAKPKKLGIEGWVLCESDNGYVYNLQIYTGKVALGTTRGVEASAERQPYLCYLDGHKSCANAVKLTLQTQALSMCRK